MDEDQVIVISVPEYAEKKYTFTHEKKSYKNIRTKNVSLKSGLSKISLSPRLVRVELSGFFFNVRAVWYDENLGKFETPDEGGQGSEGRNVSGRSSARLTMSVPRSMQRMVTVPSGSGMSQRMNARKGEISGMFEVRV